MPSLSELPGDLKRNKLTKALKRLGFEIDTIGGKGSHYKIICPNQKTLTVQHNLDKKMFLVVLKEIEKYSGIAWKQVKKYL